MPEPPQTGDAAGRDPAASGPKKKRRCLSFCLEAVCLILVLFLLLLSFASRLQVIGMPSDYGAPLSVFLMLVVFGRLAFLAICTGRRVLLALRLVKSREEVQGKGGKTDRSPRIVWVRTFLLAMFAMPLVASVAGYAAAFLLLPFDPGVMLAAALPTIVYVVVRMWVAWGRRDELPHDLPSRCSPILTAFVYYVLVWLVTFHPGSFHFPGERLGPGSISPLLLAFYAIATMLEVFHALHWFPWILLILYGLAAIAMCAHRCEPAQDPVVRRRGPVMAAVLLLTLAAITARSHQYGRHYTTFRASIVPYGHRAEMVDSREVQSGDYLPFRSGNRLRPLEEMPALVISSGYPRLDGATSACPIYGVAAEMLYRGLDETTVSDYVSYSRTAAAYERLIRGEVDVFFGLQPSPEQIRAAETAGVKLVLTPIARDAFVFFVHRDNPVDGLTLDQVQDIYRRKITSWKQVGGPPERILPFQRPENSGSQTIMADLVMRGKPMSLPMREMTIRGMGAVVQTVAADYHNFTTAIGYSFLYYVTEMMPNTGIKLLVIDGVAPTRESIRDGSYPLAVEVYAVTAGTTNENAGKLIGWLRSEEGRRLIERSGYVAPTY